MRLRGFHLFKVAHCNRDELMLTVFLSSISTLNSLRPFVCLLYSVVNYILGLLQCFLTFDLMIQSLLFFLIGIQQKLEESKYKWLLTLTERHYDIYRSYY